MKATFYRVIPVIFLMVFAGESVMAQIVGGGPAETASSSDAAKFTGFFVKGGAAMPVSAFKILPEFTAAVPASWKEMPVSNGNMGAKTGFYLEAGIGLNLAGSADKDNLFGFYYFPVVAAFWQTALSWDDTGDLFADKSIYTKPFRILDIGQRYGLMINPVNEISIGLYYRPGLIIPFNFEVTSESDFLLTGSMSTADDAPALMMSHTAGISFGYSLVSISSEWYFARPTMDVTYLYAGMGIPSTALTGKIPVKLLNICLAVSF